MSSGIVDRSLEYVGKGEMMADISPEAPGEPNWLMLHSPDIRASMTFYGGLFGWDHYTITSDKVGDDIVWMLGGPQGAEVGSLQALADDTERASWTCYFLVSDVGDAVTRARAAGGLVLAEEIDLGNMGRAGLVADPEGVDFGFSEPYTLAGISWTGEPATMCWGELSCRDIKQAKRFYGQVFGWTFTDRSCHSAAYADGQVGDRLMIGMLEMDERWPSDYPAHWSPFFAVADCDASANRAAELGGKVRLPPTDIASGRFARLTDPTGASLAIVQLAP
ncbi:VOC family protein [Actinomadura sp. 9N407]|uniref:VOC family protein n=1 Tax=Actinomadura sp. 9N407 TaxID=3375154 RepID=UPI003797965A